MAPILDLSNMNTIEFQELIPGVKLPAVPLIIPGLEGLPQLPGITIKNPSGTVVAKGARIPTSFDDLKALFGSSDALGGRPPRYRRSPGGAMASAGAYPNTQGRVPAGRGSGYGENTVDILAMQEDLELDLAINELEDLELDDDALTPIEDTDELIEI